MNYRKDCSGKLLKALNNRITKIAGIALLLTAGFTQAAISNASPEITAEAEPSPAVEMQQSQTASGVVVDAANQPLLGVTVLVKGTTTGTITNLSGEFSLSTPVGSTLVISFLGYQTQEVVFTGARIRVQMLEQGEDIDEVVVVGYATIKKVNLTGAVSSISEKAFRDRPIVNLGQGLQGQIPNLTVTTSGRPGEGSSFLIRGTTSLSSGGTPLVLVDGVEMDPNLINSNDIASVSVLKDAASSAIYGSRAAFGVVLIQTKSGRKSQPAQVSFNATYSINSPTTRPDYMNSWDYANWMNAASMNDNGRAYFDDEWMQHIKAYYDDPANNSTVFVHSDPSISGNGKKYSYAGNTDWMKELYKNNYSIKNYNVSIRGGSDKATYYTSAGFMDQGSLMRYGSEGYKKFNVMNNISYEINKWFNVSMKTSFNRTELSGLNQTRIHGDTFIGGDTRPIMPTKHPDGNWAGQGSFTNFIAVLEDGGSRVTRKNDFWNTLATKITPIDGMSINLDYTFNFYSGVTKNHRKSFNEYGVDGEFLQSFAWMNPNNVNQSESDDTYNSFNLFADYEKTFGKHYLKGLVGYNQESKHIRNFSASRDNLISNDIPSLGLATGTMDVGGGDNSWALRGAFFRLNYGYDERYLLEVNGRYDLSSRFPESGRDVFNPSVSAAWRISNESFFEGARNVVDELKIRGSYGSLGNQSVDAYQPYLSNYSSGTLGWLMGGQQGTYVIPGSLVSSSLTWETATQWDLGLDFVMLRNRLRGSFDYYERRTSDILIAGKKLPAVLGASSPVANAAEIKTRGWEFEVSWSDRLDNGLAYSVGFNISDYQAEVTKFDNPSGDLSQTYYEGMKVGEIWGYQTLGLFQSQEEIDNAPDHSKLYGKQPQIGDIRFANRNGDNEIYRGNNTLDDPGDMYVIGNSTPRYQYGIRASAEWKNFDLNLFFQGVGKRDLQLPNKLFLAHYSSEWSVPSAINQDYWRTDNPNAMYPRPTFEGGSYVNLAQTRYLQNASYLRLKALTFGYTIPKHITTKFGVDRLRVYFSGENLFTIKDTPEGFDPELTDPYKYPFQKSFAFGINITF